MPLTLYYYDMSPQCRAVNLAVHALGINVDYKTVDLLQREQLKPEFVKINHQHSIPVIVEEDGFVLWDSHAINQYLVSKYGKSDDPLYPKDLQKRAIVDQRLHYSNDIFFTMRKMTRALLLQKKQTVDAEDAKNMTECYDIVEKYLEGNDWIAGDSMTIADFSYIAMFISLPQYVPLDSKHINIVRWMVLCAKNMKGYEEANEKGGNGLSQVIRDGLKQAA